MNIQPLTCLGSLKEIPFKVALEPGVEAELRKFLDRPHAAIPVEQAADYLAAALAVTERCVAFADAELARLVEQRFALPDPNTLKARLLGEPKRLVDQSVNQLKQKLSSEKQEWTRRINKQLADVSTAIEQHVDTMEIGQTLLKHEIVLTPDERWLYSFEVWRLDTLRRWADHLSPLLRSKTEQLVAPELEAITAALGTAVNVSLQLPPIMPLPARRERPKLHQERSEVPTAGETFFEMFKGSLTTVAMIAGMVVIPVVGSLMHSAPTEMRALIMGGTVAPITLFAFLQGRNMRKKLMQQSVEKARDKLKKSVLADVKAELDRFRPDAERFAGQYCGSSLSFLLQSIEPLVTRTLERRERDSTAELARAQLAADKLNETTNNLRQLRAVLTGQALVELRRRLSELQPQARGAAP